MLAIVSWSNFFYVEHVFEYIDFISKKFPFIIILKFNLLGYF